MSADKVEIQVDSSVGGKNDSDSKNMAGDFDRIQNASKDLLGVPRNGHRKSFMEEESAKEKLRVDLLKQCSAILKESELKYNKESLHRIFQDDDFLDRLFRLFDLDGNGSLVQEDWIEFLKIRVIDEKQLDFIEQVESVAYVLCGDGVVACDAFKLILKNKVVTKKLLRVVDTDGDGWTSADEIMAFVSAITTMRPRTGIDKASVDRLEQLFKEAADDGKEITRDQFKKILVSKNSFFTDRVFDIFDEDNSGAISQREFIAAVHQFGKQSAEDKIRFLFKVYDLDGDGLIQASEIYEVLKACMDENGLQFSDAQLQELTCALLEDGSSSDALTCDAFGRQLADHAALLDNLTTTIDRWLVPPPPPPKLSLSARLSALKPYQLSLRYFRNNHVLVLYLLAFFCVNLGLFVARIVEYWDSNVFVIFARACGQCLNFNCSWVLVLMLRCSITALRSRGWGELLPLDHHIYLHKLTGVLIVGYSVLHSVMHLCNFCLIVVHDPVLNAGNWTAWQWVGSARPARFGLVAGAANPTGLALLLALAALALSSRAAVRRGGCFEVFYFTHLLYIPFWLLLIFHAPNFWKWFIGPGTVYVIERILRLTWMRSERGKTYIASGILLPSRVTQLVVKRPPLFHFHAGDYVFVNIPEIARYEWHPFTISSAPEQDEYIWLHIRGVGEWTNRLYSYFENEQRRLHGPPPHEKVGRTNSTQSGRSSRKGSAGSHKRSVDLSPLAFDNNGFCHDEGRGLKALSFRQKTRPTFLTPIKLLEKSNTLPNVFNNVQQIHKNDLSPAQCRWESMRCLRGAGGAGGAGGEAHSIALRYMRARPAVVACRAPPADLPRSTSLLSMARRRFSKSRSPERDAENNRPSITVQSPTDSNTSQDYPQGKPLEIYLDGPYGAASSHILRAQHAVLIAAGIGVTPFASILQTIMHRFWAARSTCPGCGHTWTDAGRTEMTLKKVDFFWINREQRSFEWFVWLLAALELEQAAGGARLLDMHMYCTALTPGDPRALGLQLALDLLHEKENRDLITGLKTRTISGRPRWERVFQRLAERRAGDVTVFYCGPPRLARALRRYCDSFGFHFRKEVF